MREKELIKIATFMGQYVYGKDYAGRDMIYYEITHYFNKDMEEIGYTTTLGSHPTIFDPPRLWDSEFFKRYKITKLWKNQKENHNG